MPAGAPKLAEAERARMMLGLLESVERGGAQSRRLLAAELGVVAVVDPYSELSRFAGVPVTKSLKDIADSVDAALVTDIRTTRATAESAIKQLGTERVLIPVLLGLRDRSGDAA